MPEKAILSDLNPELMDCYIAVRDEWQRVEMLLQEHHDKHSLEYYYEMRGKKFRSAAPKAARFIYLNRTCWNGLYRVNLKGKFNVPIGTKTAVVLSSDNFEMTASLLRRAELACCDFEETLERAQKNDFVFADPPYTVRHNSNGFIKYNEKLFSWADQVRLRDAVVRATDRGAKVLVTNANHPSVRKLYKDFSSKNSLSRQSILAADAKFRSKTSELLIQCWQ